MDGTFRFPRPGKLLGGIALTLLFVVPMAHAQSYGRIEETNTNVESYFYFAEPGEGTIAVKVLGTVRNPGLYRLGDGLHLDQLLALTGGPVLGVRQKERDRETTVRLFRRQQLIYEREFEDDIAAQLETYPSLKDGDIMTIEVVEDRQFEWRDALTIVSAAGTVAFAIAQFVGN